MRTDVIHSEEWRQELPHECLKCMDNAVDFPPTSGCRTCAYAGWIPPPCATHFCGLTRLGAKWTPSVFLSLTDFNECTKYPKCGWWPSEESGSEVPIHMTELKEWRPELRERMPNMWYDEPQRGYFRIRVPWKAFSSVASAPPPHQDFGVGGMAAIRACFPHNPPELFTLVEFYRSKLVGLLMILSSDTMEIDLHADQYKAIDQGRFAVTTLFSCMMLHGHTYGPLRHLLRREWSFVACCFANMDDVAKYHYPNYNV